MHKHRVSIRGNEPEASGRAGTTLEKQASRMNLEMTLMRKKMDRLLLAYQGMWALLSEYGPFTDEAILNKIKELDGRDAGDTAQAGKGLVVCPSCGRSVGAVREACVYCGAQLKLAAPEA